MAGYNRTRSVEALLEKTESKQPSFTVHLHTEYWVLNNGSKFLYQNQIASLLDDIRAHRIPVDFLELFEKANVPFYEGCMIVELLDYRPAKSYEPPLKMPKKTRVVLHPNPETLWADICSLNEKNGNTWTDRDALEVEAKLLLATSEPLCLDPDPHLTRIVNHVLRVSTPSMPLSLKRKASTSEPEEDGPEKAKRGRLLSFMAPPQTRPAPSYRLLDAFLQKRVAKAEEAAAVAPGNQYLVNSQSHNHSPAGQTPGANSPADIEGKKFKKVNTPQPPSYSVAFVTSSGSHTPVPAQPTHQFVNTHPPSMAAMTSMIQPQVYPSFQASTEAAKRAATPAQHPPNHQQYMHYQQPPQPQQPQLQPPQPQPQLPHQPQQSPVQQQPQPLAARPPSQPHHPHQPPQHIPPQAQQRFTQSPKPPVNAASPIHTQPTPQPYPVTNAQFQPPIPNAHFLQQPPLPRAAPKSQLPNGPPPQPHPPQPQQGPSTPQLGHHQLYAQQLQQIQSQQQHQQQNQQQQQQQHALLQQRAAAVAAQKNGGRSTPQIPPQQQQARPQSAAATPSPARGSPLVMNQQLAAAAGAAANRSSPLVAKAQISQQGQGQPQHMPQQHPLASQNMMLQAARVGGSNNQFTPAQVRALAHGSPQANNLHAAAATNGTPTMAAASPRINGVNGRPITPHIGPDGKPQIPQQPGPGMGGMQVTVQAGQGQTPQPTIRRQQTPLQQAQQLQGMNAGSPPQIQHPNQHAQAQAQQAHAQAQAQAQQAQTQAQAQALNQAQMQAQVQAQMQAAQLQAQVQMQAVAQQQHQAQQAAHSTAAQVPPHINQQYAQMYGWSPQYNSYWRPPPGMVNGATNMTPHQQAQLHQLQIQNFQQQQQQQQAAGVVSGGQGMMPNAPNAPQPMNIQDAQQFMRQKALQQAAQMHAQAKAHAHARAQSQAQAQAQMQAHAQVQAQAQAVQSQGIGKGKGGAKKGVAGKKPPQR